ncbi:hypothetical protein FRC01_006292, partial [Tulasnella sp. 417]
MLLAERDRELAEVNKMKKLRAKALAEKRKAEGEAMDIDGQEGETRKEESPAEEDALICLCTFQTRLSRLPHHSSLPPGIATLPVWRYDHSPNLHTINSKQMANGSSLLLKAPYTDPLTGLRYHDKDVFAHIRTL